MNEEKLIKKIYYETLLDEQSEKEPIQYFGEAFMEESKKDIPELSAIRFAQGEIYFDYKDFETAIFKWQSVQGKLEDWAKKNIADAYFELGLLPMAEDTYHSVDTTDLTLKTEIYLQLFSLYIERDKFDLASQKIKQTVAMNPDYPNVTMVAKAYFEKQQDWSSAIELALNEAARLESVKWFDTLIQYAKKGHTVIKEPVYFAKGINLLATLDPERFEELAAALWDNYIETPKHMDWVFVINGVISSLESNNVEAWSELTRLYETSYLALINGDYLVKEVETVIPPLLKSWLKICDPSRVLAVSAAILSWEEIFNGSIEAATVYKAENYLVDLEQSTTSTETVIELAQDILTWASKQQLQASQTLKWMLTSLMDIEEYQLLLVGSYESGKSSFVNSVINGEVLPENQPSLVMLSANDHDEIDEISETEVLQVEQVEEQPSFRYQCSYHVKLENDFLNRNDISLIHTPDFNNNDDCLEHVHLADGILFVLNANNPLNEREIEVLKQITERKPNTPVHFLLNKMDSVYDEREAGILISNTAAKIRPYVENAQLFAYSPHYDRHSQLRDLSHFLNDGFKKRERLLGRTTNLLYYIRMIISYLINQRIDKENSLVDSIKWNEAMVTKVSGAVHQVGDQEIEKIRIMTRSYNNVKDAMRKELLEHIPDLLKGSTEYINEDSDFGNLYKELNDEMNRKVLNYLENAALPQYYGFIQNWIEDCTNIFNEVQSSINEMADSFNELYGEEKLKLECDFKVLDDWRRDADRMTSGIHWENMNIFMRSTPAQFLLKSAGKLLGGLGQNKTKLYNKYKQLIESEDYVEVANIIANKFFQQFELFEKSLDRDVAIFFRSPLAILKKTVEESNEEIDSMKEELKLMRTNPEYYRDPLTFFEVKLRQNEWLNQKESKMHV
ncbi:GTP-binding protein [Niallia sp. Krafla_26]|uniref:GTP-binding protein n=1 Tax=Niallia sp. Krafla_26 TaxID=3064703 RepID=UPI003D17484A